MAEHERCPTCGKPRGYLLETHATAPGLSGLLRGEGEDPLLNRVAWLFVLLVVFAVAAIVFALMP